MSQRLDAAALMAAASDLLGLDDFGDPAFVEPFERLVDAVNAEGTLDATWAAAFAADMTRLLCTRLAIQAAITANPEIEDEDVSDPIIVTGLARTGTTKLHRALAVSPEFQKLLLWQALFPAPWGPPGTDPDPRITITEQQLHDLRERFPEMMAVHPVEAREPEEEVLLLQLSFRTVGTAWVCHGYSFIDWVVQQDQAPAYADLRRALQYLQWQDGGRRGRPWVLKAPIHLHALDTVLATFPRATVVHCHRDPHQVIPSTAQMQEIFHNAYGANHVGLEQIGRNALLSAHSWESNLAQRVGLNPAQILDVDYTEICSEVGAVVTRILASRGSEPSAELLSTIAGWETENPQYRHGRSGSSLDRYGLTPRQVDEAFSTYTAFFART
ncbi:sulfotransferase [Sporichthya sp.]|uniref:sulfotransferase family protein n=1 Tax=Sporichthya sp. TaxID=65475 RepID=UPI001843E7CB|nr:sulfotransferase [Sporichthya sp.]MBA3743029.1 sulfotransferase [Sporichthya sp.]